MKNLKKFRDFEKEDWTKRDSKRYDGKKKARNEARKRKNDMKRSLWK